MQDQDMQKTIRPTYGDILPEAALAVRWGKSIRTMQRMRMSASGPPWFAIGRTVFYRLSDILAYETASLRKEAP